jgi:hypothetical protein
MVGMSFHPSKARWRLWFAAVVFSKATKSDLKNLGLITPEAVAHLFLFLFF